MALVFSNVYGSHLRLFLCDLFYNLRHTFPLGRIPSGGIRHWIRPIKEGVHNKTQIHLSPQRRRG